VVIEALSAKVQFSCRTETTSTSVVCPTQAKDVLPAALTPLTPVPSRWLFCFNHALVKDGWCWWYRKYAPGVQCWEG